VKLETLAELVRSAARLGGQALHRGRVDALEAAARSAGAQVPAAALVQAAWQAGGLEGEPQALAALRPIDLPAIAWHAKEGWLIVQGQNANATWSAQRASGEPVRLADLDGAECVSIPRRGAPQAAPAGNAAALVWAAVWQRRLIFFEALVATLLINLLLLAVSLYTMQVYDRVIPNQGFDTLWVLSVGVLIALGLEFMLKQVRSIAIDRTCNSIDRELSEWFFGRALGIRMDARPQSVGTLAAQIKGFETVRAVMTSTPLFVLADLPFALFFTVVIFFIGGKLALVPLLAIPACLIAGLAFQGAIQRAAREHQARSNSKTGLLVEAIDGAESLKANSADWKIQARWNHLVDGVAESEYRTRRLAVLSQQLTQTLQQFGYVAIIAVGAYLVADNQLTLGALIGCAIIANRALSPIIQLPGVMLQWAHARAALAGLDAIIGLPNETDEDAPSLVPQSIAGELRLERCRFRYGADGPFVLEGASFALRAGESAAIIGAIGAGKSTLLKLASGLYRPADGKVFLDGIDMATIAPAFLRERIAYLPQEPRLFSGTLRDNLLVGLPDPGDEAILQAARRTGLFDLISGQPKGLALPIAEGGRGISGGQRQQVALTRLLLGAPRLWLLDEPTTAMDAPAEQRIVTLMREVTAGGATLVVSTHKTALLRFVDRILVLHGGRVAADGPREQIMARIVAKGQERDAALVARTSE